MRLSIRFVSWIAVTAVVGPFGTIAQAEPPATDARWLESAVDRLGLLAARSEAVIQPVPGSPTSGRSASSAMAKKSPQTARPTARPQQSGSRSTSGRTAAGRQTPAAARRQSPDREPVRGLIDPYASEGDDEDYLTPEATTTDLDPVAVAPENVLSSEQEALRDRVRKVLGHYYLKPLNTRDNDPWETMHGIVAYGVEAQLRRGGPDGDPVNAIAYLSTNGRMAGMQLLFVERDRINAQKGVKVQGHYGQLLAILGQSRVKADYPLRAGGQTFTVADLIETEKLTCRTGIELTFKLISFAHYLDSDETWINETGEEWDIPRLIAEELKQPILSNAACGGTHRLMGFSYAVRNRKKQQRPIDGQWLRAEKYLDDYHRYTFALQNSDGSFSTEWFRRREAKDDINRRLQTTGHILEWMVYSLPEQRLDDPRLVKATNYLTGVLLREPNRAWEIGPLGHALHSLAIYDQRRFKPLDEVGRDVAQREATAAGREDQNESGPHLTR